MPPRNVSTKSGKKVDVSLKAYCDLIKRARKANIEGKVSPATPRTTPAVRTTRMRFVIRGNAAIPDVVVTEPDEDTSDVQSRDISVPADDTPPVDNRPPPKEGNGSQDSNQAWWKDPEKSNDYEKMLLGHIVDTDKVSPEYQEIAIDRSIIDRLEQLVTLSYMRWRAFSHGILRDNRITGAVLYGPPGTSKTLLAKSVARACKCDMLAISASELWQMCDDEDKMVKAVFSLSRKMHPCIVFLDEADAMLGVRKAGEKRHTRAMFNRFLLEWDSNQESPFLLIATNRLLDLDPAVLRRAPVHIKLGLPSLSQRQDILRVLLEDESLFDTDCARIAAYTHGYTGDNLRNMCIQATMLAVAEQPYDTDERILMRRHFDKAIKMIRPAALPETLGRREPRRDTGQGVRSRSQEKQRTFEPFALQ